MGDNRGAEIPVELCCAACAMASLPMQLWPELGMSDPPVSALILLSFLKV